MNLRSFFYKGGSVLGDINALSRAFKTGSADPIVKRVARKQWTKTSTGMMNRWLK